MPMKPLAIHARLGGLRRRRGTRDMRSLLKTFGIVLTLLMAVGGLSAESGAAQATLGCPGTAQGGQQFAVEVTIDVGTRPLGAYLLDTHAAAISPATTTGCSLAVTGPPPPTTPTSSTTTTTTTQPPTTTTSTTTTQPTTTTTSTTTTTTRPPTTTTTQPTT